MRDGLDGDLVQPATSESVSGVPSYATWTIRDIVVGAVLVLVLFFLLGLLIVLPFGAAFGEEAPETLTAQMLSVIVWDAAIVFVLYRLALRSRGAWWRLGLRAPSYSPVDAYGASRRLIQSLTSLRLPRLVLAVVTGYAASIFLVNSYGIIVEVFGIDALQPDQQVPKGYFDHDWLVPLIGVAVVLAAPIAEELFFRGFLYAGLRRRLSVLPSALISGGLFSLAHIDPGLVIPFTMVGMVLAYTYERTGTIYAPIAIHLVFNLFSFLVLVFAPESRGS